MLLPMVNDKVTLHYKAFGPEKTGEGLITEITKGGFYRIKGKTGDTERNKLFDPVSGYARGYNTLWFTQD